MENKELSSIKLVQCILKEKTLRSICIIDIKTIENTQKTWDILRDRQIRSLGLACHKPAELQLLKIEQTAQNWFSHSFCLPYLDTEDVLLNKIPSARKRKWL